MVAQWSTDAAAVTSASSRNMHDLCRLPEMLTTCLTVPSRVTSLAPSNAARASQSRRVEADGPDPPSPPRPARSPGGSRERRRTRRAIVEATSRLLAAGADPSINDIAAPADVSRRTIYTYFPTLDQLLLDATVGAMNISVEAAIDASASRTRVPGSPRWSRRSATGWPAAFHSAAS